jgi:ABC-2 type transport system ATP-binding protein
MAVVSVESLRKSYGGVAAVDGVSLEIEAGEIFGMVGPNGAGKTTTMDCMTGMRTPDSGRVSVLGLDPSADRKQLLRLIGIQQQDSELPERMKVREAMELFSSFYDHPEPWPGLLEALDLSEKSEAYFSSLSGGQKRRLFVALSLVCRPTIVFLDELTSGLDPHARRSMWDLVRGLRDAGRTVFLSTHYMDEAERLCDRVAVMDRGRVVALGTPDSLVESLGARITVYIGVPVGFENPALGAVPGVSAVSVEGGTLRIEIRESGAIVGIVRLMDECGVDLGDFRTERATLEDVFLKFTGRGPGEVP